MEKKFRENTPTFFRVKFLVVICTSFGFPPNIVQHASKFLPWFTSFWIWCLWSLLYNCKCLVQRFFPKIYKNFVKFYYYLQVGNKLPNFHQFKYCLFTLLIYVKLLMRLEVQEKWAVLVSMSFLTCSYRGFSVSGTPLTWLLPKLFVRWVPYIPTK